MTHNINEYRWVELEHLAIITKGGIKWTFGNCRIEDTDKDGRTQITDHDNYTILKCYLEEITDIEIFYLPFN